MDKIIKTYLHELKKLAEPADNELYIVGGTIRDLLLGKISADYDFTCRNAPYLASLFAEQIKRPLVPLDATPGRETFRVVIQKQTYFDFSQMQGNSIEEDLSRRDFTFNAMAIHLRDFLAGNRTVLDLHHGIEDLRNRIVRVLPGPIFSDDPLRMLRAFRFASTLKLTIENTTLEKISEFKSQLARVAPERIYYELSLFLKTKNTYPLLVSMDQTGFLNCLLPEITVQRDAEQSSWQQALQTCQILDTLATTPSEPLYKLAQLLENDDWSLLKLAALIHRLKDAASIMKRLRASNAEVAFVDRAIAHHEETLSGIESFAGKQYDEARIYRFTKQGGKELIPALLLATASHCSRGNEPLSNPFAQSVLKVYDFYSHRYLPAQGQPPLLSGDDLIKQFKLPPSPLFKTILDQVEEHRVLGIIKTRQEAEALAKTLIDKQ